MKELPISSQQHPDAGTAQDRPSAAQYSASADSPGGGRHRFPPTGQRWAYLALAVIAVLLLGLWWNTHKDMKKLRSELARRLATNETASTEIKVLAKSVQDATGELQGKVSVLESKQAEAQNQQLALEQLYQELSKNRDEWVLAEIEQVLSTASQQLQLAGNVQGALIALQNADNRLAQIDKPQFITIRRAIGRDLEKLKSLPIVDLPGIALRIDSMIGLVDQMPLLASEKPSVASAPPRNSRREARADEDGRQTRLNMASDWMAGLEDKWNSWTSEMWNEVKQLIQVRNVEVPEAILLSPSQAYYVRENLKLRLLNARLALLSRNEPVFRSDTIAAQDAITKYFDTRAKQTQSAQALLKQVQSSDISIEMPTLNESLNAVRNYKAKP